MIQTINPAISRIFARFNDRGTGLIKRGLTVATPEPVA